MESDMTFRKLFFLAFLCFHGIINFTLCRGECVQMKHDQYFKSLVPGVVTTLRTREVRSAESQVQHRHQCFDLCSKHQCTVVGYTNLTCYIHEYHSEGEFLMLDKEEVWAEQGIDMRGKDIF